MSELNYQVLNAAGGEVGSTELDPAVFGAPINEKCVHMVVRYQLAKRRAGTHSVLTRSNMKGGGKKPYKQKGTGHARAGSAISPLWTGGAVVFGPTPRSYEFKVTKGVRRKALQSVLSQKVLSGNLRIVEDLRVESGKTKDMKAVLAALGIGRGAKVLIVADSEEGAQHGAGLRRASRNLPGVTMLPVGGFNVYDAMRTQYLVTTKAGIDALRARVTGGAEAGQEG